MSKELKALEKVKFYAGDTWINCVEWNIIETALKRLEQIEINQTIFENNPITVGKKIIALEIIKDKEMLSVFKDLYGKCFIVFNTTAIEITQEEYRLLKEVLL